MKNLYPKDDPRFVASRSLVDAEEEKEIGRHHSLVEFMKSLTGDSHVIHIHEDMGGWMNLRATWHPDPHTAFSTGGEWDVVDGETEMDLLQEVDDLILQLAPTKVAAVAKLCITQLFGLQLIPSDIHVTLGQLDAITDTDPELD